MALINTESFCATRTQGHKTICTLCGKDVTGKTRLAREELDAAFRDLDGFFTRISAFFRKLVP